MAVSKLSRQSKSRSRRSRAAQRRAREAIVQCRPVGAFRTYPCAACRTWLRFMGRGD